MFYLFFPFCNVHSLVEIIFFSFWLRILKLIVAVLKIRCWKCVLKEIIVGNIMWLLGQERNSYAQQLKIPPTFWFKLAPFLQEKTWCTPLFGFWKLKGRSAAVYFWIVSPFLCTIMTFCCTGYTLWKKKTLECTNAHIKLKWTDNLKIVILVCLEAQQ